ncbi:MAG: hypothetical protein U0324_46850 [Polyangiales bacterium]
MKLSVVDDPGVLLRDAAPGVARGVALVAKHRALLRGHFALQSGQHAEYFLRFAKVGWDEADCAALGEGLGATLDPAALSGGRVVVFSPESAGYFLGRAVARALDVPHAIARVDLNRCPVDRFRSEGIAAGDRVVLVNDVVTSAGSLEGLRAMATRHGGTVVAARVFASLAPAAFATWSAAHGVDGWHLVEGAWPMHDGARCPLCQRGGDAPVPAIEFN